MEYKLPSEQEEEESYRQALAQARNDEERASFDPAVDAQGLQRTALKALRRHAEALGFDPQDPALELRGTMYLAPGKVVESFTGAPAREYDPAVRELYFALGEAVSAVLPDSEVRGLPGLARNVVAASRLRRYRYTIPYDYSQRFLDTETRPRPKPFAIPFAFLSEATELDRTWLRLVGTGQREAIEQFAFAVFSLRDSFETHPCTIEFYRELRQEYLDQQICGLSFTDYFDWFQRSQQMFDAEGALTPETAKKAERMLHAWRELSPEMVRSSLRRNLEIHPRHHPIIDAFAEAWAARNIGAKSE